jgi:hypothetical protein
MRKLVTLGVVLSLCACNLMKKSAATDEGGTAAASSAGTTSAGGGGIVSKGLSFLTGGPMQGEIDFMIKSEKGENGTVNMLIKGTKQRMEMTMAGKNNAVIMDGDKKEMIVLDEDKKTAMIMKLDSDGSPGGPGGPSGKPSGGGSGGAPKNDCVPNGKSDTVAGYDCNICVVDETDTKSEACVANGLSFLGFGGKSGLGALAGKMGGFPLRAIKTRKSDNKEVERFEVTKIERKNLGDDKFQIPPGYKTVDMADMFKGLGSPPKH